MVKDILVKMGGSIIPVDFVVLHVGDMRENGKKHTLLLRRLFMAITITLIAAKNGTLKMIVLEETLPFSVCDNNLIPSPSLIDNCSYVDFLIRLRLFSCRILALEMILEEINDDKEDSPLGGYKCIKEILDPEEDKDLTPTKLELKELPKHLK